MTDATPSTDELAQAFNDLQQELDTVRSENERLRERINELEADIETVEDQQGRKWSVHDLLQLGLSRRQAVKLMSLLAAGSLSFAGAYTKVVQGASTTSGRYAAKVMQAREVHDRNDNTVFDFDGSGGVKSITTEKADITKETYIRAHLSADKSGIASSTYTNIVDNEDKDARGEFNSSYQFVPDETAEYTILAMCELTNGADGDEHNFRVYNTTDDIETAILFPFYSGSVDSHTLAWAGRLTAGKAYEIQARNRSSSFTVASRNERTRLTIIKGVVHA